MTPTPLACWVEGGSRHTTRAVGTALEVVEGSGERPSTPSRPPLSNPGTALGTAERTFQLPLWRERSL
eukprot:359834-Chlamydomonas_euryale.AAC.6